MPTWIEDKNGNRCSVERWGSKEAAQKALDSLVDCSRCSGCSHVAFLYAKQDLIADPSSRDVQGAPIIPVIPDIHKRIYAAVTAPSPKNPLDMRDWHTCEMTHCRGGWVVTLAGDAGKALEKFHGTLLAAQLIYDASDTSRKFNPCRFFDSNEEAMADMKRLAEK